MIKVAIKVAIKVLIKVACEQDREAGAEASKTDAVEIPTVTIWNLYVRR